jgi:3-hydroxyisobutyrate dehydrogenase
MNIGFIGLGIMGRPMAKNLLKAGFDVTAYNRSEPPRAELAAVGARIAESPAAAARDTALVITIVTDSPDVEQVCLGTHGIIASAAPGTLIVDMSTISPDVTRRIGAALAARDIRMVDAPVSGGESGAMAGSLSIMAGGDVVDVERARPVLEAMGKRIVHCGTLGAGQTVKLCNQIAVALANLAVCEAIVFARKSGVDPARMLEAVSAGAGASWQMSNLGPKMLQRDFRPGFKIGLQQKDLRLALESARQLQVQLPGLALVHELFAAVESAGCGEEGTQALLRALEDLGDRVP